VTRRASQKWAIKELWLSEPRRKAGRVPQRPPASRSTGKPEGPRHAGDFFLFVFFLVKENERKNEKAPKNFQR
jgi:hypothetical protein